MNALESPLEALAFNYVSFGIFTVVNNLWTWVAVITAAISFWRIRTTSDSVKPEQQHRTDRNTSGYDVSSTDMCVEPPASSPSPSSSPASVKAKAKPVCGVKDVDGVTKGSKFTLYYYLEKTESGGEFTVVKEWRDDNGDGCGEWWESLMRVRMGDMGWYRNQDLTMVNGNVVKLWDECRRRERYYRSPCGAW